MPEINIKETRFIPEKPNVIKNEQIEVYIPTGGYHKPGVVSFDSTGFIIDQFGHVKLRRNSVRNISNFEIDYETGVLTVYYDDDTVSKVNIPTDTNKLYSRNNLSTTIDIEPGSFVLDMNTGHWFVPISNRMTGFKDDKFIASLEVKGTERETEGYYTVPDTIFKGTDGSLLISVDTEDEKNNFHGRLLLFGGSIFTDNQVISITQDASKRLFTIHKSDGTREYIQAVSEEYVKDYVNQKTASVYVAKGNVEFSKLPSIEELATGDYLGYVYNVTDSFVADIRFDAASYGKSFSAGTNVVVARNDDGTYQFDVLGTMGGMMDLSDYISNEGGTIHGGLVFDGVSETVYSSIDANEFKLANANKELSVNLSNITLYDVGTSTYIHVDYPTQSGRLIVDTDYATENKAGIGKIKPDFGIGLSQDRFFYLIPAYDSEIDAQNAYSYKSLLPRHISKIVKVGVTTNTETLTDEEKAAACEWIGAVNKWAPNVSGYTTVLALVGGTFQPTPLTYGKPLNSAIACYGSRGVGINVLATDTPLNPKDCANKEYVDDGFVAKLTYASSYPIAYIKNANGTEGTLGVADDASGGTIALRDNGGRLVCSQPVTAAHVANKGYVDNNFVAKPTTTDYGNYVIPYIVSAAGQQGVIGDVIKIEYGAGANSIPRRGANGILEVGTATSDLHAVNKGYVDDNFRAKYIRTAVEAGSWFVYTQNQEGVDNVLQLTNAAMTGKSTIPFRDYRGCIPGINAPENSDDAANKGYVDNGFVTKPSASGVVRFNATDGTSSVYPIYQSVPPTGGGAIPVCKANGRLVVGTPVEDVEAVNKQYFNDNTPVLTRISTGTSSSARGCAYVNCKKADVVSSYSGVVTYLQKIGATAQALGIPFTIGTTIQTLWAEPEAPVLHIANSDVGVTPTWEIIE